MSEEIERHKRTYMIGENLHALIQEIESARLAYSGHHIVKILAASKYASAEQIMEAYNAGQRCFGENRVQALTEKMNVLSDYPIDFHFIGSLQENKINALLNLDIGLFHSLDSLQLAQKLHLRLQERGASLNALLQVNASREESKHGFPPEMVRNVYAQIREECPSINLIGIMCMGPNTDNVNLIDKCFATTKNVFDSLSRHGARVLSMGMSGDYKIAISNGSNLVRIGSAIFRQ